MSALPEPQRTEAVFDLARKPDLEQKQDLEQAHAPAPARPLAAGAIALQLLRSATPGSAIIFVAPDDMQADAVAAVLPALDPTADVVTIPAWDALPGGRVPPSSSVMGRRVDALRRLSRPLEDRRRIVVATADALAVRMPDPAALPEQDVVLAPGDALDEAALVPLLQRLGYRRDERVDEPGEYAVRGEVIEVFPATAELPVRIERGDGAIETLRRYDPLTQRSTGDVERLALVPATEVVAVDGDVPPPPAEAIARRVAFTDVIGPALVVMEGDAAERGRSLIALVGESRNAGRRLGAAVAGFDPALALDADAWESLADGSQRLEAPDTEPLPEFAAADDAGAALRRFLAAERKAGRTVVLATPDARSLRRLVRLVGPDAAEAESADDWSDVAASAPGSLLTWRAPVETSFRNGQVVVIAAPELVGNEGGQGRRAAAAILQDDTLATGDVVVHREHGLALYRGLTPVETTEEGTSETIRLVFADEATLLVPVTEARDLWRYGTAEADVSLDTLGGSAWLQRREAVEREIADVAVRLATLADERASRQAPACSAKPADLAKFAARFPYPPTPDQRRAFADVAEDLSLSRPMDRLVCGDVGFGKTEVALRAAAVVALSGRQVAVAAPTTLLARQHAEVFRRRFEPFGIVVRELSRFVSAAKAKVVKAGLADGSVRIVVGTHALAAKGVRFKDLGLVVVDEEQRFGEAHKTALRALHAGVHTLTMTATPIPRTLQTSLAGLREVSVLATPPVARRPVRTVVAPYEGALLRDQLMAERARGGRSFVVCPRIEDIEPMRARLAEIAPELALFTLHARMAPRDIDDAMIAFAEGDGDVLLATSIVESGLDVPGADTMVVWRPERFGLAQLHQIRGRVGRGRVRGHCLLMTDPDAPPGPGGMRRLAALAALDGPGAGFAVAARDLDMRGAGDLAGMDQTGHMRRVGVELTRHLLARALSAQRGETVREEWTPELALGCGVAIPEAYVPEQDLRLEFYRRAARVGSLREVEALADEIEDRFGDPPEAARQWLDVVRIGAACRALGLARFECGPRALAITPRTAAGAARLDRLGAALDPPLEAKEEKRLWPRGADDGPGRLRLSLSFLASLAAAVRKG